MSRPNVVLVAGWGMPARIWQPVAELLQPYCHVYGRDLLTAKATSLAEVATQIAATVPQQAIWCGWSLGGLVARYWASQQPVAQVLTIAHNPCFVQQIDYASAMPESVWTDFQYDFEQHPDATWKRFLTLQCQGSATAKADRRLLTDYEKLQASATSLAASLRWLATDSRSWRIACPQSALLMAHDALVPMTVAESLMNTQVTVWPQASHCQFISQPQFFADWLCNEISTCATH